MYRLTIFIILTVAVLRVSASFAQYEPAGCLNADEELMAQLVNEYRVANSLPEIPISHTLTLVGQWHVADHNYATDVTQEWGTDPNCNLHTWYGIPGAPYSTCCYTNDHAQIACVWDKPREVSDNVYTANGFELAAYGYSSVEGALMAWQASAGHNEMILNLGMWSNHAWLAMGAGVDSGRYFVWFSTLADPEGEANPCVSSVPDGDLADLVFLGDAYPNPFNPQTTITFDLPRQKAVNLRVFNVSGRLERTLIDGELLSSGRHEVVWNGRDESGRKVASGTYFFRLEVGGFFETKRMVLLK